MRNPVVELLIPGISVLLASFGIWMALGSGDAERLTRNNKPASVPEDYCAPRATEKSEENRSSTVSSDAEATENSAQTVIPVHEVRPLTQSTIMWGVFYGMWLFTLSALIVSLIVGFFRIMLS